MQKISKKPESDLFKGFEKKQAPIQKVVQITPPKEDKNVQFMLVVPEEFKEKLELYKLSHKKKSLKAVIMELVGPAIGYDASNSNNVF